MTKINNDGASIGSLPQSIIERKMTPFETYIALCKGYCILLLLILPKAFAGGGYIASSLLLIASGVISAAAATMLVESGLQEGIFSYPRLIERAFGKTGKIIGDIVVSVA